jgi:hypothetical protein
VVDVGICYPDARALKEDILDAFPGYGETILPLY